MALSARRALSALTAAALLTGLLVGTPNAVRAAANTQYVAVEGATYRGAHAADCNAPDQTVDGVNDDAEVAVAVEHADGGTVFFCSGDYYFTSAVDTGNVELVGAGAATTSISGGGTTRIFESDSDVVLSGLTLRNANSVDEGGAISAAGTVEVADAVFEDNFTLKGGGAIAAQGQITVTNSEFRNNSTTDRGGAIATFGFVAVHSSEFTGNSSIADENCIGGGGAIAAGDDVFVDDGSTFTDNSATLGEATDVGHCDDPGVYGGRGGAILTAEFELIYNASFVNNSAMYGGGAIYALALGEVITEDPYGVIDGSRFTDNTVIANYDFYFEYIGGNAVFQLNDDLHISNSSFSRNSGQGSAVMVTGDVMGDFGGEVVVTDSDFTMNTGFYGGAISAVGIVVAGSTFSRNEAVEGGALIAQYFDISSSRFTGNSAAVGGAVFYCGPSSISDSVFTRNTANKVDGTFIPPSIIGYGGAVAGYVGTLTLMSNWFTANRAAEAGGAVWFWGEAPASLTAMIKNRFKGNRAGRAGGAVGYALNDTPNVPSRSDLRAAQRQNRFSGNHGGRGGNFGGILVLF